MVPLVGLQCVIVVFPDHIQLHLLVRNPLIIEHVPDTACVLPSHVAQDIAKLSLFDKCEFKHVKSKDSKQ